MFSRDFIEVIIRFDRQHLKRYALPTKVWEWILAKLFGLFPPYFWTLSHVCYNKHDISLDEW